MSARGMGPVRGGVGLGWLLLWSTRRLPTGDRPASVAVVVPARDEAGRCRRCSPRCGAQLRVGDELVVVDDHSTDGTAAIGLFGARRGPGTGPARPAGSASPMPAPSVQRNDRASARVPRRRRAAGPTLLDGLAAATTPGHVVSVQPWHDAVTAGERVTLLANVAALMGCAAFTVVGERLVADVAFGPVLAIERTTYDAVGGHGHPTVRASLTEDIALARRVGRSLLFTIAGTRRSACTPRASAVAGRVVTDDGRRSGRDAVVGRRRRRRVDVVARRRSLHRLGGVPVERAAGVGARAARRAGRAGAGSAVPGARGGRGRRRRPGRLAAARGTTTWKGRPVPTA